MDKQNRQVVLSGVRATGKQHLGNFLGVFQRFARLSRDPSFQCFFFIADWHTLTTMRDAARLKEGIKSIVLDYLAAGIDPASAVIYPQSAVLETAELMWYLACLTPEADLRRMPHFKEKSRQQKEGDFVNAGLLNYPVLMAADILGPKADLVPVGKDQLAHLELAQSLARRFNNRFGQTFFIPDALKEEAIIVPGLDGTGKMGKTEGNTINLDDPPEVVVEKLRTAVTDPSRARRSDPGDPAKCNIYTLHTFMSTNDEITYVWEGCRNAAIGCVECKALVAGHINKLLGPFQERRVGLCADSDLVPEILRKGIGEARAVIAATVAEVRAKVGMGVW
ncbi:MAG: tryptophan--tRNA ligase [Candidatus Magasanikbacteria bacterium]|nr:tryptophan--tRNA ligase [Candidatus Magasanikbacteria bacterium]